MKQIVSTRSSRPVGMNRTRPLPLISCFLLGTLLVGGGNLAAQDVTDLVASGKKPFGSYQSADIDHVDLNNGGVTVKIPLVVKTGRGLNLVLNMTGYARIFVDFDH